MYNYPAPGQHGRAHNYGGYPGAPGGFAPGMGPPPSLGPAPGTGSAPGVSPPPGMAQAHGLPARPGGIPPSFAAPLNMPANVDFSAPVIRLGMSGPPGKEPSGLGVGGGRGSNMDQGNRGRMGLGAGLDQQRAHVRENMMALAPPTREEIMRTIFIGNITDGISDVNLERILQAGSGGKLRRWTRAYDADNKACKFGFAEFEDAEGLETVAETLKNGVDVPAKRIDPKKTTSNGETKMPDAEGQDENSEEEEEEEEGENKAKLLVVVDEASAKYATEWRERRNEDESATQFRVDSAREDLDQVINSIFHPTATSGDYGGDVSMQETEVRADPITGEVVTISINVEDELEDIPVGMRETVAAEIAAFRERSNIRDQQRLKREEEMEAAERQRNAGLRVSRLASPPLSAPSGPGGSANGIPLGPRGQQGIQGAPSGPKGYQGIQMPKDYQNGVSFVNGLANGNLSAYLGKEDNDSDADDEELERRRQEKKEAEMERLYLDHERRWLNREKSRTAAVDREKNRHQEDKAMVEHDKEAMAKRLREWDDNVQAELKTEDYYQDRGIWLRNRNAFKNRETIEDDADRLAEERERGVENGDRRDQAHDSRGFDNGSVHPSRLAQQDRQPAPAPFKLSLGAAAARAQQQAAPTYRRTVAEVEGLLEDEEEEQEGTKRTLVPIQFDPITAADVGRAMSDEERQQAVKQLAADIPTDKEGLWKWEVHWESLQEEVINEQLRPYVEKQILSLLGVQEEMLVAVIEEFVKKRGKPEDLVGELEGALDEEAEGLVKKLWRMIIFFSESEKRGLSA